MNPNTINQINDWILNPTIMFNTNIPINPTNINMIEDVIEPIPMVASVKINPPV